MNKKKVIIIILILIVGIIFYININNNDKELTEKEIQLMSLTDDVVIEMISASEFEKLTLIERKTTMVSLLNAMKSLNLINNVTYNEDTKMFLFQYSSGVLGEIIIEKNNIGFISSKEKKMLIK